MNNLYSRQREMSSNEAKLCQGKDVFERMNYLYQASRFVAKSNKVAAAYYGNVMISCGKKSVLRMEPDVKRTICKNCKSPLIPGETARIRLVSKPVKAVKWTCLACNKARKIPSKGVNKLWINEPESLVQMYDYTPKSRNSVSSDTIEISSVKEPTGGSHSNESNIMQEKRQEDPVIAEGSET